MVLNSTLCFLPMGSDLPFKGKEVRLGTTAWAHCWRASSLILDPRRPSPSSQQGPAHERVTYADSHTGSHSQRGFMLGIMLCCCHLEMLNMFWTRSPIFSFCSEHCKLCSQSRFMKLEALSLQTQGKWLQVIMKKWEKHYHKDEECSFFRW